MLSRIIYYILLFFIFFLPLAYSKEETIVLTLDEAIAIASRGNKDILLNQERLAQEKLKIEEAKGAFLPDISVSGSDTYTRGSYRKDIVSYSFQAGVRQYIYKGGESVNNLKQAKYKAEVQSAVLDKTKLNIGFNVKKAFYAILIAREFSRINRIILENSAAHYRVALARYKKGEASESELLKAKSLIGSMQSLYVQSRGQLENARILLKNILYVEKDANIDIRGELAYAPKKMAIDDAILKALSLRQEIRQYEAQAEADKARAEAAKAGSRPSIYGSFDYYSRSTTSLTFSPSKGWQDYNVIGVTLSWPVFDGWATRAKVEQALIDVKQARILQDKYKLDVATEVKSAYLSLKTALAGLEPRKSDIAVYADNARSVQEKYKEGIASALDVFDARLALLISQFNQSQALYECLASKAELDKAMGVGI